MIRKYPIFFGSLPLLRQHKDNWLSGTVANGKVRLQALSGKAGGFADGPLLLENKNAAGERKGYVRQGGWLLLVLGWNIIPVGTTNHWYRFEQQSSFIYCCQFGYPRPSSLPLSASVGDVWDWCLSAQHLRAARLESLSSNSTSGSGSPSQWG